METIEIVGIISAGITLAAFVGNEYGKVNAESIWYDGMNFLGSIGLLVYAAHLGSLPFMVINTVWSLVAGFDVVKYFWGAKKV